MLQAITHNLMFYRATLKNERFKHMPHDGSSWDRILKWADNIGGVVLLSLGVMSEFMLNSEDATRLICDSCTSLLQVGADIYEYAVRIDTDIISWAPVIPKHF